MVPQRLCHHLVLQGLAARLQHFGVGDELLRALPPASVLPPGAELFRVGHVTKVAAPGLMPREAEAKLAELRVLAKETLVSLVSTP